MSNKATSNETITTLGFDTYSDHGPGIFLTRLKQQLEQHDWFNQETPDVWVNLSFTDVPEAIEEEDFVPFLSSTDNELTDLNTEFNTDRPGGAESAP